MPSVQIASYNPSFVAGTIGVNGTQSEWFDLAGYTWLGLVVDQATNGTMNFVVGTAAGDNYRLLKDNVGANLAITLPTGGSAFRESDMRVLAPYRFVRIITSVAQANGPTFTFVVK